MEIVNLVWFISSTFRWSSFTNHVLVRFIRTQQTVKLLTLWGWSPHVCLELGFSTLVYLTLLEGTVGLGRRIFMRQSFGCLTSFKGINISADGGIGRRTRFKLVRTLVHGGSNPPLRIK